MSAVLNAKAPQSRPALSLVPNLSSVPVLGKVTKLGFPALLMTGFLAIGLLNLLLNLATSTGVYQVAGLKAEKARLDLNSSIISQQVDSLSSNQNLASAAQAMGMIANANPVFLDVKSKKVYGAPASAIYNDGSRVSGNLVANSQWTTKTDPNAVKAALAQEQAKATQTVAASVATTSTSTVTTTKPVAISTGSNTAAGYVGGAKSSTSQVVLGTSGIPAAPTH